MNTVVTAPAHVATPAQIRHLPDVANGQGPETVTMVIQIRLESHEPPTGTVTVEGRATPALAFVGWLGLLRVLSELFPARSD